MPNFNCIINDLFSGKHRLTDTYKVMLSNTLPSASNTVYADIIEITTNANYTAGGLLIGPLTVSNNRFILGSDATFVAASVTIGPFRYMVIYNDTQTNKPLLSWYDYGYSITIPISESFVIDADQINGIFSGS